MGLYIGQKKQKNNKNKKTKKHRLTYLSSFLSFLSSSLLRPHVQFARQIGVGQRQQQLAVHRFRDKHRHLAKHGNHHHHNRNVLISLQTKNTPPPTTQLPTNQPPPPTYQVRKVHDVGQPRSNLGRGPFQNVVGGRGSLLFHGGR